jgi:(R,R)-butanediol dehydrogenase/meso-butanediol dehydrogenase/diacetyl reductase
MLAREHEPPVRACQQTLAQVKRHTLGPFGLIGILSQYYTFRLTDSEWVPGGSCELGDERGYGHGPDPVARRHTVVGDEVKAAVYYGQADIRIERWPDPTPGADEVVLEVHAAGICGTDASEYAEGPVQYPIETRHPVTGHLGPMIPGHELCGRVVARGPLVTGISEGDLVVSGAGISCSTCAPCRVGQTNLCKRYATIGLQRHGGLAQYCAAPAGTCVRVEPFELSEDTAALAQPMAIAHHSMTRGHPVPGEHVVVFGAGGIGTFLTFALARLGADVLVADSNPDRLRTAKDLGAGDVVQAQVASELVDEVRRRQHKPVVIYEVTGTLAGFEAATALIEPGGRIVAVGLHDRSRQIDLRGLTLGEISLVGTMAHVCAQDLPAALELLGRRDGGWGDVAPEALPLERLVPDGILPLVEGRGSRIKTLIDPWAVQARSTS